MTNTDYEMINLDDVIAETGDTDPFNTNEPDNEPSPNNEFVDLDAMIESNPPPNAENHSDETPAQPEPDTSVQSTTQKSLLDYILELAAREINTPNNTTEQPPQYSAETTDGDNETASEPDTQPDTGGQPPSPENLPSDVNQLLEEAKNIILNARITQYAQEQANLIRKEVNDLAAIGIRVTQPEIENIVQDALQKGVEPVEAFRAYAYRLIKIQSITGTPLRPKQNIPHSTQPASRRTPVAPQHATPAEGEFISFESVLLEMMGEE